MNVLRNGNLIFKVHRKRGNLLLSIPHRPKKFLKIHRLHVKHRIATRWSGCRIPTNIPIDSKIRPTANDIEPAIILKILKRKPSARAILNFIEKQKGF